MLNPNERLQFHVRDGLSQEHRHLPALEKNYFNVDEMGFEQLLRQMQEYAYLVNIFDAPATPIDAGFVLFDDDEVMVMAHILAIDCAKLEKKFEHLLRQEYPFWENNQTQNLATPPGILSLLDSWLKLLGYSALHPQTNSGLELANLLENILIALGKKLAAMNFDIRRDIADFSTRFSAEFQRMLAAEDSQNPEPPPLPNQTEINLRAIYLAILASVEMLQTGARRLLPLAMQTQLHDPAAALRIAFIALYRKIQHKLNTFTLNFIDFYLQGVLQAQARPQQPDSVYLVLQHGKQQQEVFLAKGTEFLAGRDKHKQDIIYTADDSIIVNDAKIARLHTLFFPRQSSENQENLADGCWLDTIPVVADETNKRPAYAFFGETRSEDPVKTAKTARLGFAIASNVLLLHEGKREIHIELEYLGPDEESAADDIFSKKLKKIKATANAPVDEKACFFQYFGKMFDLSITTAQGWLAITEYKPGYRDSDPAIKKNCLQLSFSLTEDSPGVVGYKTEIHGEALTTSQPLLRFTLRDNHLQYPYDLLKDLELKEIRIAVNVDGCHDLLLHNQYGQLSPLAPFTPFGPLPEIGSYLIVGNEETRSKQLTRLDIELEWGGLPTAINGFSAWYKGYADTPETTDFLASVSVLADGKWWPRTINPSGLLELFAYEQTQGVLELIPQKNLSCNKTLRFYKPQNEHEASQPYSFTTATKAGLFKVTLQGPPGAFGHQEYPQLLSKVLSFNALVRAPRLFKTLPNQPYTPKINAIRLNYAAATTINLANSEHPLGRKNDEQFFHIHPLGWEEISGVKHPKVYQLPQYDQAGTLYIGLQATEFKKLSLFFHLKNDSLPMNQPPTDLGAGESQAENLFGYPKPTHPAVNWFYLRSNQWRPLPVRLIYADSTHGFMRSGIVTLDAPPDINTDNTIIPSDLYWLKITANAELNKFSHLYAIYAQAVKATWASGLHPLSMPPMVLPPNTIKRSRQTIPGLAGVQQICASFGGVPEETRQELRTRLSERLRHKNRAITPHDYELLILEKFPEVYKVKCFTNVDKDQNHRIFISPGRLLIIPTPYLDETAQDHYRPIFDGHLIRAVQEFVSHLAPAFARIRTANPEYEEIQVRCAVQLKLGCHIGQHHNLLNRALCDYLSPWSPLGNKRHFGWTLREQEIISFIKSLDYIEYVTEFSMLRIASQSESFFTMDDTANSDDFGPDTVFKTIEPKNIWNIAVPMKNHNISSINDHRVGKANITGCDQLEVGSTFII